MSQETLLAEKNTCIACGVRRSGCSGVLPQCGHCYENNRQCTYDWDNITNVFDMFSIEHNLSQVITIPSLALTESAEEGAHGEVYCVESSSIGKVAVKVLGEGREDRGSPGRLLKMAAREAWIWSKLQHDNIMPFLGIADRTVIWPVMPTMREVGRLCLVSPWTSHGSIMKYLGMQGPRSDGALKPLLLDVIRGLNYLHLKEVVHGDLKGNNILIRDVDHVPRASLTDFGLSYIDSRAADFDPTESDTTRAGNRRWLAFEVRLSPWRFNLTGAGNYRTKKTDVFELMRAFLEILTGYPPYFNSGSNDETRRMLNSHENPNRPILLSDRIWELMERAWSLETDARPTLEVIEEFVAQSPCLCT